VPDKGILIDRMPDLFDFYGSDGSLQEHERVERQRRISIFYPSGIPSSLHSAVLLQWVLQVGCPAGGSFF